MKTSCGKFLNFSHYFPYHVKLRLLAHSRSFLANQIARNAVVGAENLLMTKSKVQMAGYWPMEREGVEVHKLAKKK